MAEGVAAGHGDAPAVGQPGGPGRELSEADFARWYRGRELFGHDVEARNGLGPLFDADSCRVCHCQPFLGGAGRIDMNMVFFGQLAEGPEFTVFPEGLEAPKLSLVGIARREIPPAANIIEQRKPASLLGLGLVDRIPADVLLANADPDDADLDGVSGRPNMVDGAVGRFGRKAAFATLRDMVAYMADVAIGLTLPGDVSVYAAADDDDAVADPEWSAEDFDDIVFFVSHIATPAPAAGGDAATINRGREVFDEIGCGVCHVPSLDSPDGPVNAYSDFLLHEITLAALGNTVQGISTPTEFRTAPLWGLRDTGPYLHNGAADTIDAAILSHFGEGQPAQDRYFFLPPDDRDALLAFLESL